MRLLAALKLNARASLSELALDLGVARATVRARLQRLEAGGDIVGYTIRTRHDLGDSAVRGLMMLGIEGRGTEKIITRLHGLAEVRRIHTTNGTWDLILELTSDTLEHFDQVLFRIRAIEGVTRSETNLLLSTRHHARHRPAG